MPSIEAIRLKIRNNIFIPLTCEWRNKRLKNKDFTIISNNCWGGTVYEAYNLKKQSPTIGIFFMAEDYITFLSDLEGYMGSELTFIKPEQSRWKDAPQISGDRRFGHYPVGQLFNEKKAIEIFFLHYHSESEARDKWERRIKRINWNKLLIKFNDQNGCTEKSVMDFIELSFSNKIFFTCKDWPNIDKSKYIVIRQFPRCLSIKASYEPFGKSKYIDITSVLNSL